MSKENAERPRGQRLPQTKPPMDDEDLFLSPTPRRRANGGRSLTSRRKSRPRSNTFAAPSSSSTPTAEPSGSKAKRGSSRERGGGGAKTITEESGKQSLGNKMEEQEDLLWRKQNENQGEEDEGTKTTTRMERGGMPEGTLANKSVGRTNVIIICCLALLMASAFVVLKQKSTALWVPLVVMKERCWVLPGVPQLYTRLLEHHKDLLPQGMKLHRSIIGTKMTEGDIAEALIFVQNKYPEVSIGSYPQWQNPELSVRVTLESTSVESLAKASSLVQEKVAGFVLPVE